MYKKLCIRYFFKKTYCYNLSKFNLDFCRNREKYELGVLLLDLNEDATKLPTEGSWRSSEDVLVDLNAVKAAKQRLIFMDYYIRKYRKDLISRLEFVDMKISHIDRLYNAMAKIEEAETRVREMQFENGKTGNENIAVILNAFLKFAADRDVNKLVSTAQGKIYILT